SFGTLLWERPVSLHHPTSAHAQLALVISLDLTPVLVHYFSLKMRAGLPDWERDSAFIWNVCRNFIKRANVSFSRTVQAEILRSRQQGLQGPQMLYGKNLASKEHQA